MNIKLNISLVVKLYFNFTFNRSFKLNSLDIIVIRLIFAFAFLELLTIFTRDSNCSKGNFKSDF